LLLRFQHQEGGTHATLEAIRRWIPNCRGRSGRRRRNLFSGNGVGRRASGWCACNGQPSSAAVSGLAPLGRSESRFQVTRERAEWIVAVDGPTKAVVPRARRRLFGGRRRRKPYLYGLQRGTVLNRRRSSGPPHGHHSARRQYRADRLGTRLQLVVPKRGGRAGRRPVCDAAGRWRAPG
jgi:hypothetical protein